MKLYVGNLSYEVGDKELKLVFAGCGQVESAVVIKDKFSGRSKGFGFVEMPNAGEARQAIERLNGQELLDRAMTVNEARPMGEKPRGPRGGAGHTSRPGGGYGERKPEGEGYGHHGSGAPGGEGRFARSGQRFSRADRSGGHGDKGGRR